MAYASSNLKEANIPPYETDEIDNDQAHVKRTESDSPDLLDRWPNTDDEAHILRQAVYRERDIFPFCSVDVAYASIFISSDTEQFDSEEADYGFPHRYELGGRIIRLDHDIWSTMASLPYEKIVNSEPFKFLVGPSKAEFEIHASLVAEQSPALARLVTGDFIEARERRASWRDVDVDTFIRFSQFAYTGDYDGTLRRTFATPSFEIFPAAASYGTRPTYPPRIILYREETPHETQTKQMMLWERFRRLYPAPDLVVPKNGRGDNYSEEFLCHARMYVFADCYGISALQSLALQKLHHVLKQFALFEERIGDVAKVVQYCYENTPSLSARKDALRRLIGLYAACAVRVLWTSQEFVDAVGQDTEFLGDLITNLMERLD
ncbi:hypothetical protein ACHAQH_004192 [Verticillium albo-atrum]